MRWFIARHGETVYNAVHRMQGDAPHTPLTRAGFAQADAMGEALRRRLGSQPPLTLWASPTGRALQTLAVMAEHLDLDWHETRTDARLSEIAVGEWGGRYYRDVFVEAGDILDRDTALFTVRPPGGEWYDDVAVRLSEWLAQTAGEAGDRLVVTHGMTARVLRGLLTGLDTRPEHGAPVAPGLPQGTLVELSGGVEAVVHRGTGGGTA